MDKNPPDTQLLVGALEEACRAMRAAERAQGLARARSYDVQNAEDRVRLCRVLLHSACLAFTHRVEKGKTPQAGKRMDPYNDWPSCTSEESK